MKSRRKTKTTLIGGIIATLALGLGTSAAWASGTPVDLTGAGSTDTVNGAVLTEGKLVTSAGTGVLDPFLRIGNNKAIEQGYNTDFRPLQYDEDSPWTEALLLSTVPTQEIGGKLYRVFFLDINQSAGPPSSYLSLDKLRIYLGNSALLTNYDPNGVNTFGGLGTFGGVSYPVVWDLDGAGDRYIWLDYDNEAGSGQSDMTLLVPEGNFGSTGKNCEYGQAGCTSWVYMYNLFGEVWANTANFEEWSTSVLPYVQVTKTAVGTFDRNYGWTIDKTADGEYWKFIGDPATKHDYKVVVDQTTSDSNIKVSGTINIKVPATLPDGEKPSPDAVVTSVKDVLDQGGVKTDAVVTCPSAFPFTVKPNTSTKDNSVTCTYTMTPSSSATGTNTATVTIKDNPQAFVGTADVTTFTENSIGDKTVTATDTNSGYGGPYVLTADKTVDYSANFSCPTDTSKYTAGVYNETVVNTANIKGATVNKSDIATVKLHCYLPLVSKTAAGTYTKTYTWTIDKEKAAEYWKFIGDPATSHKYDVAVVQTITPSDFKVAGQITVKNPNPNAAMAVALSDVLSSTETATIGACTDGSYVAGVLTIPAGKTAVCDYSAVPGSAAGGTNYVTATLNKIDFKAEKAYTFTAKVVGSPDINVDDTNGKSWAASGSASWTYNQDFSCPTDTSKYTNGVYTSELKNTATIRETGQSDSVTVKVNCYLPLVSKDAKTTYTRTYDWNIAKKADQSTLKLKVGQTFVGVNYEITVNVTGFKDSAWNVTGTITIKNPNPKASMTVDVADVIESGIAAKVDCGAGSTSLTVAASGSGTCSYSSDLPDATKRLNTATATLNKLGFTGTADVVFGDPSKLVDECINVYDDNATPADKTDDVDLGKVCYNDTLPKIFKFARNIGPYQVCGDYKVTNTAWFVKIDSKGTGESSWTININVPCEGCTLTQGYWKTHSKYGPAPYDADWGTWEDTAFFSNVKNGKPVTWYQMFWMVPQGGNPYIQLAHQWEAAYLNSIKSVDPAPFGDLQDEFDAAKALLAKYTWNGYNWKTDPDGVVAQFKMYASLFGSWNEGIIGPGHCSEDKTSSTAP